jgi:hypothetical protein
MTKARNTMVTVLEMCLCCDRLTAVRLVDTKTLKNICVIFLMNSAWQVNTIQFWGRGEKNQSKELIGDVTVFSLKGNSVNTIVHRTI